MPLSAHPIASVSAEKGPNNWPSFRMDKNYANSMTEYKNQ